MSKVYLAMYKAKGNWADKVIRLFTGKPYSHCEIAVEVVEGMPYCYSSSPRDGGVRCKIINVSDRSKWDLVELPNVTEAQVKAYFEQTQGKKYDLWGALGVVFGFKQRGEKFFCSEWCFNAIFNSGQGWRFSPNQLAVILNKKEMLQ